MSAPEISVLAGHNPDGQPRIIKSAAPCAPRIPTLAEQMEAAAHSPPFDPRSPGGKVSVDGLTDGQRAVLALLPDTPEEALSVCQIAVLRGGQAGNKRFRNTSYLFLRALRAMGKVGIRQRLCLANGKLEMIFYAKHQPERTAS
ncbi:MAG: hypothetical protein LBS89_09015 [Zoogloeaceae bacterium]|jgi:hypothetical protein|nr:hypothetical protein [Zoogloeaceae bacterium]